MEARRLALSFVVLGAVSGVAAVAVVSGRTPTSTLPPAPTGSTARVAHDDAREPATPSDDRLPAFGDCEDLRRWYVRAALKQVGPWGLDGPPVMAAMRQTTLEPMPTPGTAVAGSSTGTNVQEADVDESDVAKTDGRVVVRVIGRDLVVTDVSGAEPLELSRTRLPGPALSRPELLLHGSSVLVVGPETRRYAQDLRGGGFVPPRVRARSHLVALDLSRPSAPRVTGHRTVDAAALSTRLYADGTVRVVLQTAGPRLRFVHPGLHRTPAQATEANRRVVRRAPAEAWLPTVREGSGPARPLAGCSDVRHPRRPAGPGTISVLTFPADAPDRLATTAVSTEGDLVYSSADRLYVASPAGRSTTISAFALEDGATTYTASGEVRGTVRDRWSLSEYDGHLRVATALGDEWDPRENAVVVLAERGGRLAETGRVGGIGPREQVRAVRWLGAVAVLVTFRQTDPVFTLDLGDPDRPRLLGRLEVPGFSAYLHPLGAGLLLGLGRDATQAGADRGAQAATFDLRDLGRVRRTDTLDLGSRSYLATDSDPRALGYLPARRTAIVAVADGRGRSRFVALRVGRGGALSQVGSWADEGVGWVGDLRALPVGGHRVALAGADVRLVDVR